MFHEKKELFSSKQLTLTGISHFLSMTMYIFRNNKIL